MSQENVEVVRGIRLPISRSSEKASQRRTLDERIFVRFPAPYRVFADRLFRLPLGSRLRRLILDRVARRAVAAANRRDFDVLLYGFDPTIEFELPDSPLVATCRPTSPGSIAATRAIGTCGRACLRRGRISNSNPRKSSTSVTVWSPLAALRAMGGIAE
jgi:hypothetical protein